jgi:hypothetical protein
MILSFDLFVVGDRCYLFFKIFGLIIVIILKFGCESPLYIICMLA